MFLPPSGANRSFIRSRPVKRAAFFWGAAGIPAATPGLQWVITTERASAGTGPTAAKAARVQRLERLLFDVRAGRLAQFVLPADPPRHVFVSSE